MTHTEQILDAIKRLERLTSKLERVSLSHQTEKQYLSIKQVLSKFDVSDATLAKYRKLGKLKDVRCNDNNRKFYYSSEELEKVFRPKMKLA